MSLSVVTTFFFFFFLSAGRGAMKTFELGKISAGSGGVAQRSLGRPAQGHWCEQQVPKSGSVPA